MGQLNAADWEALPKNTLRWTSCEIGDSFGGCSFKLAFLLVYLPTKFHITLKLPLPVRSIPLRLPRT
ncbi:hypothetical protein BRADI_1g52505v3 [Brachypodium distachyon]|uniref:Uncharacterized protein n=1 Tax=Brachypodium distachyon TaxID=15368 RepID=A0A2K2DR34_BRADI|nr:hypothetical protein BRADI_1g52505v3 [Brachypodium distachyon]